MELLPVAGIVLAAAFTQGVLGFAFGLIAMATLPWMLGFHFALAFVASYGLVLNIALLWSYRTHFDRGIAFPLIVGGLLGVPVGFLLLRQMDPTIATKVLGALVTAYAVWKLTTRKQTERVRPARQPGRLDPVGVCAGLAGGILGAAFNTGGPPVVMYGALRRWSQGTFKAVIQGFFLVAVVFALSLYAYEGYLTFDVFKANLWCLPALLVGLYLGARVSDHLDGPTFRLFVLLALLVLGIAFLVR